MENLSDSATFGQTKTKSPQPAEAARHTRCTPATLREALEREMDSAEAGAQEDLDVTLRRLRPRLYAIALRFAKNHDDAEDIVQEALFRIWRNIDRFEGRAALSTWSHRITVNASLDSLRRQQARSERVADVGEHDEGSLDREPREESTPESLLGSAQVSSLVRTAIASLSPAHRQVIELRELEDHSYEEIAARARCPVGTVMSRLHHARRRLATALPALEEFGAAFQVAA
jgi:RNA polymerase sigma-70 factor (ECF subfamily)